MLFHDIHGFLLETAREREIFLLISRGHGIVQTTACHLLSDDSERLAGEFSCFFFASGAGAEVPVAAGASNMVSSMTTVSSDRQYAICH